MIRYQSTQKVRYFIFHCWCVHVIPADCRIHTILIKKMKLLCWPFLSNIELIPSLNVTPKNSTQIHKNGRKLNMICLSKVKWISRLKAVALYFNPLTVLWALRWALSVVLTCFPLELEAQSVPISKEPSSIGQTNVFLNLVFTVCHPKRTLYRECFRTKHALG